MFSPPADDDDLFIPQHSSNLAELFGNTAAVPLRSPDLMYVAPKQPKRTPNSQAKTTKAQHTVLLAKVVKVFKIENNVQKAIGKYGLAIVGNSTSAKEIMLYKDKQNVLAKATLASDFQITIDNDYVYFNDNNRDRWQVQLEDEKNLAEFTEELNKSNIKINKIKVIDKINDDTSKIENNASSGEKNLDNHNEMGNAVVSQSRADILSRMAKMGQSILPKVVQIKTNDSDDSSTPPPFNNKQLLEPKIIENGKETYSPNENFINSNANINDTNYSYTKSNPSPTQQLSPYIPVLPSQYLPNTAITLQDFNMFASENRIQNSEVRMNLTTISNKLDNVLNEISKIREPNTDRLENEFLKSKISDLERHISNLTKQTEETNNSKTKCRELESLIQSKDQQIKENQYKITELENSIKSATDLQEKLNSFAKDESELNAKICDLEQRLKVSEEAKNKYSLKNIELEQLNKTLIQSNVELHENLKFQETKHKTYINATHENLQQKAKGLSDIIKNCMNFMYQNIIGQIEEPSDQTKIKSILSLNIKQTTFSVIQQFQDYLLLTKDPDDNE